MKFKHIAAVLAGAAALSAPSCDLNEKFYSEVTPDTFFTSPESTYAVLCRPFTHWKWYIGADRWYLQELTTDEMTCPKRGADWYNGGEYYRLHYHTWSPDDRFVVNTYDGTTGGISRALEAKADLESVDYNAIGLSDAVKADHINQLNAITAYFYMKGLDYVERVNELLEEPARFPVRSDGALSTELRILAVMRLGITDSGCIASFLNCASATVYTYRTKLRNSALGSRSDFENRVRRIGL